MKVETVTLHNFGSFYGLHQVRLSGRGLVFVRGENLDEPKMESNGAGKSTVFDALDWALFGKVPKGDVASSVVNNEAGKHCWVVVELTDGKSVWHVYRYRGMSVGNGVRLFENGSNQTSMDESQTTARIESVVGMDRKVFLAAVYRQQGDTYDFARATDGERKKMLTRLIPELGECDVLRERAASRLASVKSSLSALVAEEQRVSAALEGFKATDVGQLEQAWRSQHEARLQQALVVQEQAAGCLDQARASVALLADKERELASVESPVLQTPWAQEHARLNSELQAVRVQVAAVRGLLDQSDARLAKIRGMSEGPCSECGQPVTGDHLEKECARLLRERSDIELTWAEVSAVEGGIEHKLKSAAQSLAQESAYNQSVLAEYNRLRGALDAEVAQLRSVDVAAYETAVDQAASAVLQVQQEQWTAPETQTSIKSYEEELAALAKERGHLEAVERHYQWWHDALGNKGIKSYIIDSRIGVMTEAANSWVQALTGGTFWIRFETQSMTSKGGLSEKFNVRVFRHNPDGTTTESSYLSLSGGEKKRVSLGIDQGLSELVARRATVPWGLYIIDESFRQHMDSGGREAVFELLQSLDRDSIIVVDHDKEMSGQFERHLDVRIQNRRSYFPGEPSVDGESPQDFLPVVDSPE